MSQHGVLRRELQQNRPFRSSSQEATLGLFRTADVLRRRFARVLEPSGVTLQQYNVLRILRGAGDAGLNTLTVAERMVERAPGVTRLIDRLHAKGLVERERSAGDRRCVVCRITRAGLDLLDQLDGPMDATDDASLAMLTDREQEHLIELLDRIRNP
jgi:DNA-binding MarR family transcriptional regulator